MSLPNAKHAPIPVDKNADWNLPWELFTNPNLFFLDEPTTGLDPQSRAYFWEEIKRLKKEGMTIFLTTHYLEEADNLCDHIAIIDHGTIVAVDTPLQLKRETGGESITVEFTNGQDTEKAKAILGALPFIQKIFPQRKQDEFVCTGWRKPDSRSIAHYR